MFERLQNFGVCRCVRCVTNGPRCTFGYCVADCKKEHEYWVGHVMADGSKSPASQQVEDFRKAQQAKTEAVPASERKPEPGTATELLAEEAVEPVVFVPFTDNSRVGGGKSNFPVKYVP